MGNSFLLCFIVDSKTELLFALKTGHQEGGGERGETHREREEGWGRKRKRKAINTIARRSEGRFFSIRTISFYAEQPEGRHLA